MSKVKVAIINRNIGFYELGGEECIDDKKYKYSYKEVNNVEEIVKYVGNIEKYLPEINNYNVECNEIRVFNEICKVIIKIYGKNNVKIIAKIGEKINEMNGNIENAKMVISGLEFMF